jgi:hypothetical protein
MKSKSWIVLSLAHGLISVAVELLRKQQRKYHDDEDMRTGSN